MSTIKTGTTLTTAYQVVGDTTGALVIQTGATPTTAVTINSSQNVGVGVSSPAVKLDVLGAVRSAQSDTSDAYLRTQNSFGNTYYLQKSDRATIYTPTTQPFTFDIAGGERMRIDTAGNVGIGTSSPSTKLHVKGTDATRELLIVEANGGFVNGAALDIKRDGVSMGKVDADYYAGMRFYVTNGAGAASSLRATIDTSGNLLVGTTTSGGKLTVTGGGQTSYFTQSASGGYVNSMSAAVNAGSYYYVNWLEGATSRGAVTSNGSVMTYGGTSDYRLKENIEPMTGGLERVARLKPVTYTWKENGRASEGFIAHELQEVVPDAVTGTKDQVDVDGNPMYQNIDPRMVVATLTAAIQELKAELDAAKADIATLKGAAQ